MSGPSSRLRVKSILLAALLVAGLAAFAVLAEDKGSAAISALGVVVAAAALLASSAGRRLFFTDAGQSMAELRANLIEALEPAYERAKLRLPSARADVRIHELVRVRTRTADEGSTEGLARMFDEAKGQVVLVGEPGAGKSTAAVALLRTLATRARANPRHDVPILLGLGSWAGRARLEDWLVQQIVLTTKLSRHQAATVLPKLIPILDGLDEVPAAHRVECAEALASFIDGLPGAKLVICCRRKEFDELPIRSTGNLHILELQRLSPQEQATFLHDLDSGHWQEVIAEIRRPGSALASALSTPLMMGVAAEAWRDEDPRGLVEASARADARPQDVKAMLWQRWNERSRRGIDDGAFELAVALAKTATVTGASHLRLERLGSPATRRTWFVGKALVASMAAAATGWVAFIVLPFIGRLSDASFVLVERVAWVRRREWLSVVLASLLLLALVLTSFLRVHSAAIAGLGALAVGLLVAWVPLEVTAPQLLVRRIANPFRAVLVVTAVALGISVAAALVPFGAFSGFGLPGAVLIALWLGTLIGLDFAGHHWLARAWYSLRASYRARRRQPGLRRRLAQLAKAGFLRPTGDAYQFFHLELQRVLSDEPRDAGYRLENIGADALIEHAERCSSAGDDEGAFELWTRALHADPANGWARLKRAATLHRLGRVDDALDEYSRLVDDDPSDVHALVGFATCLANQGDLDSAERLSKRAVDAAPADVDALAWYGTFLLTYRRDHRRSEEMFESGLAVAPDDDYVLGNYARLLFEQGRDDEGRAMARRGLESSTEDTLSVEMWFYLLALGSGSDQDRALEEIFGLIRDGARSPGWDFSAIIDRARGNGHSDIRLLEALADVINGRADPESVAELDAQVAPSSPIARS